MTDEVTVEVVFALPDNQALLSLSVAAGSTVAEVVAASGVAKTFTATDIESLQVGIWGRIVDRSCRVNEGDRIEIYRPLLRDPREARRERAKAGLTMRGGAADD